MTAPVLITRNLGNTPVRANAIRLLVARRPGAPPQGVVGELDIVRLIAA